MTERKPQRAKALGVSDAEYERLLAAQGGHCALCPNTPKTRRLHVDHAHDTGKVRALLCHRCNRALPSWVTAEWLRDAADYLDPPKPVDVEAARRAILEFGEAVTDALKRPGLTAWADAVRKGQTEYPK